jgi:hypothetical protein
MTRLALLLLCASCATQTATGEYLRGVEEGIAAAHIARPPTVVIDWTRHPGPLGTCRETEVGRVITIFAGRILEQADTVQSARRLFAEVVAHELTHAALSCSARDHEEM